MASSHGRTTSGLETPNSPICLIRYGNRPVLASGTGVCPGWPKTRLSTNYTKVSRVIIRSRDFSEVNVLLSRQKRQEVGDHTIFATNFIFLSDPFFVHFDGMELVGINASSLLDRHESYS